MCDLNEMKENFTLSAKMSKKEANFQNPIKNNKVIQDYKLKKLEKVKIKSTM
jgi:hypothetical protein